MLLMAEAVKHVIWGILIFRGPGQYTIFLHFQSERANFRLAQRPVL